MIPSIAYRTGAQISPAYSGAVRLCRTIRVTYRIKNRPSKRI
jgi:hypothetical protein